MPWLETVVTMVDDAPLPVVLDSCVVVCPTVLVAKVTDRADGMLVADEPEEYVALFFSSVLVPSGGRFSVVRADEEPVIVAALLETADMSEDMLATVSVEPCDFFDA
ncbi:hypothetical protein CDV31_015926 [Fusarium ambrosium]|uniref:Uncharacterized protein n=1 Tax=Fusarium ambrosium TaxID=131363 RepID=A0A428SHK0_9HYPO|nr:hypothetical protein CDV31_015926 [Fusarium ambrosium]